MDMIKILVVEDDKDLNRTMCSFLSQNGYEAQGCLLANDAYNAMYNKMFDLIISDIMMPQIDGFEFASTVRKINPTVPIIFVTARDDFSAKQKGFEAGIDDFMVKPIDLQELLLRISALMRRANIAQSKKITRVQLMDEFWDADSNATPRAVDVYITKLRDKLSDCKDFEIVTVHGLGYKAVLK